VIQALMAEITQRNLKPGDSLPLEAEMIEKYQVGRGTLREALRFLEFQGILQIKAGPRGGPIVAAPDGRNLANSLGLLLQISETPFSAVIEVRLWLEPHLAADAARNVDDELRTALRDSIETMRERIDPLSEFLDENRHFHELIAKSAGNPVFSYLMSSLQWIIDGSGQGVSYPEQYRGIVVRSHERVATAIIEGDPDSAYDTMRDHIENTLIYLRRHYPRALERTVAWRLVGT
jgi:DNA-binding FadR family transcriptional regulator